MERVSKNRHLAIRQGQAVAMQAFPAMSKMRRGSWALLSSCPPKQEHDHSNTVNARQAGKMTQLVRSLPCKCRVLETSFDRNTTYQNRGMGSEKLVKMTKTRVKIIKQKT